ncbi:tyrosine-protein phosphatase 10D-like isoform X1 [Homarus americanus]|uniref:tyrosine-protein phosphatase 10D-like isoform X1 n=1 Tax=Homarus americanus TaxID=6706 RepID=UPI001C467CC6|nr:tyrosine-protein phosphatase 10D-like isoform X1 [Homarus americanus]
MDPWKTKSRIIACLCILSTLITQCDGADVVIQIPPERVRDQDGYYRLDYWPPQGNPPPNSTFTPAQVSQGVELTRALPGTKYDFQLYYTNGSITDYPTWTASITTVPPPPTNLTIQVRSGKSALVSWDPPVIGGYSAFKLKVIPLSESQNSNRNVVISAAQLPFNLRELNPGASYELQLYTVYENKESAAYISSNFTTRPNAPGRFIVWYRNETTMLVLWQPPYPAGIYSHYRVSIEPSDATNSVQQVLKEQEPPGPAQAAFLDLVPGRAYNITVETVSQDEISVPTTAQYRTIPLPPRNITFDARTLTSHSLTVRWEAPKGKGEFDRYHLNLGVKKQSPLIINADQPREATFDTNLEPGRTYNVHIKTVSGNVASWPTNGNVTTRPLRVLDLKAEEEDSSLVKVSWKPDPDSSQDSYKVVYQEVETYNGDSRTNLVTETTTVEELDPGRNYSISVAAVSNHVESDPASRIYIAIEPASPIIEELQPIPRGLNISWKSDVNSRQEKYAVIYIRNDTGVEVTRKTADAHVLLEDLFPGAGYEIKVYAISHGLWSEPHVYFQAVYPNSIRNLTIIDTTNTSVSLAWRVPIESLFTHYIVRYRTVETSNWLELPAINTTSAVVDNLQPGERYIIQVRSVSHRVESFTPQEVEQTVPPNPVRGIEHYLDSQNITFEWPRPEGRIDMYTIVWWNDRTPDRKKLKEIPGNQATEGINRKLTVLIGELMPGELYNFQIYTTAHGFNSENVSISSRTRPVITSDMTIVNQLETPSFTLRYTLTPADVATFDTYRFMLSDPAIPVKEKVATDDDRKIVFKDLVPGRLYNITAWTVSGGVTSQPLVRQDRLYPEPVSNITATYISDTDITLTWTKPKGDYSSFEVQYLIGDELITNRTTDDSMTSITITRLRPHRNYTFTVLTLAGSLDRIIERRSKPVSATFSTRESTPGKVAQFAAKEVKPNKITFRWSLPPDEQNGILLGFNIKYGIKGSPKTKDIHFAPDELEGTLTGLSPGQTYAFEIQARTKIGSGRVKYLEQVMPILAPPEPSHQVFPTEVSRTSSTIRIRYRKNYFSNENGPVIGYTIIVAEDDSKISRGIEMPAWQDVQNYKIWPPYQVSQPYYPFNITSVEDFDIGTEKDCTKRTDFCNGELKPGTTYKVKIRAYTSRDKFADTYFSHPITTETVRSNVVLAVAVPVLVIVLVVVVVMIMRHRRVCLFPKKAMDTSRKDGDLHSLPESLIETSRPVKLKDFAAHYRFMAADSEYHFSEEYEALKHVGHDLQRNAADVPVNRPKNRFTNILPYDHSRFKLQPTDDEEGTDYINANYVPGYNSPREFIVTQGPLPSTRDDFWRMCWESNSRAIVMLTRCIEKGREKCDHYWPYDTQPVYYGDIQVTILNESQFPDWNISELRVCKGDICRVVRHFHFTTWPDFGVPEPPQTLVRFVRSFRERVGPDQKPIVVHCSAGVGRSGTFIALDRILFSLRTCDYVDIFGIVYEMRRERVWMVQTEQQYICIHQCLLAVLEGRENEHSVTEIHDNQGFDGVNRMVMSGVASKKR